MAVIGEETIYPDKMGEYPPEEINSPKIISASNGDLTSSKPPPAILNKINSMGSLSNSTDRMTTAHLVKSCSTTTSLTSTTTSVVNKKFQSTSNQELHHKENKIFTRSISVASTTSNGSTDSKAKLKLTQRAFSVDDVLIEEADTNASKKDVTIEQKSFTAASKTRVSRDGFKSEKTSSKSKEIKKIHSNDCIFEEKKSEITVKQSIQSEIGGSQQSSSSRRDRSDSIQFEKSTSLKFSENYTAETVTLAAQQGQIYALADSYSNPNKTIFGVKTSNDCDCPPSLEYYQDKNYDDLSMAYRDNLDYSLEDDFKMLLSDLTQAERDKIIQRISTKIEKLVETFKNSNNLNVNVGILYQINQIITNAWAIPTLGHDLGFIICNILRERGCLDFMLCNCLSNNENLKFATAQLFEQCLTTENREYVVETGLSQLVLLACSFSKMNSIPHQKLGIGILEHLFKHSENTCCEVIRMEGLNVVLYNCRTCDIEVLRRCAAALANLSLYGGPENHQRMIKGKVPVWLFPLAFHVDDNIKYYACLAISVLVANKEIEAAVIASGTLNLVEPFILSHDPEEFSKSTVAHFHGQSKSWLHKLVPVLKGKREEARNLAAFHFAMEAGIKKKQGNTKIFSDIGAIKALKKVASSPNAIASKFAGQALQIIGESIPHKLSQQVPLWTVEDTEEWVDQIGFSQWLSAFNYSRVDGDLLLQLTDKMLIEDIGITNGILRKRFLRELATLKEMADYSSCDPTDLNNFLIGINPHFAQYTYQLLKKSVKKDCTLIYIDKDQLKSECGIENQIHIHQIMKAIEGNESDSRNKNLDVFISYRRSNGSQLASLLKVHLQLRGLSVFIDVERLEAGKFDNNLLNSISQAKNFILVLTPNTLDRCLGDIEKKDWVHKEIVAALESNCNIIPVWDNFHPPEPEKLPEDMRQICAYNGVRWIHDYQDACVDKIERFIKGEELVSKVDGVRQGSMTPGTPNTSHKCVGTFPRSPSHENTAKTTDVMPNIHM